MRPKISIGIPLYASAPFYKNIVRNIEEIDVEDVEILISDRHLLDDTLDRLAAHFDGDERVRCFRHGDQQGWLVNYNFLLTEATGEYFTWLPHDDVAPTPIADLAAHLDENHSTVLAYPKVEVIDSQGRALWIGRHDLKVAARDPHKWSFADALFVASRMRHHAAGKGLFRLDVVRRDGLELRPVRGELFATDAFRFGLACRGSFAIVPSAVAAYRLHSGNFTTRNRPTWGRYLTYYSAAHSFLPDELSGPVRFGRSIGLLGATVVVAPSFRGLWRWTRRGRRSRRASRG